MSPSNRQKWLDKVHYIQFFAKRLHFKRFHRNLLRSLHGSGSERCRPNNLRLPKTVCACRRGRRRQCALSGQLRPGSLPLVLRRLGLLARLAGTTSRRWCGSPQSPRIGALGSCPPAGGSLPTRESSPLCVTLPFCLRGVMVI